MQTKIEKVLGNFKKIKMRKGKRKFHNNSVDEFK